MPAIEWRTLFSMLMAAGALGASHAFAQGPYPAAPQGYGAVPPAATMGGPGYLPPQPYGGLAPNQTPLQPQNQAYMVPGAPPAPPVVPQMAARAVQSAGYQPPGVNPPGSAPTEQGDDQGQADGDAGDAFRMALQRGAGPASPDPSQPGGVQGRIEQRLSALEARSAPSGPSLPIIKLGGFAQLDEGNFTQNTASRADLGNVQNGLGFRRTRLQAYGQLTEFTNFIIEMDFASAGRPSFFDVWAEQTNLPFFGTIRIGQFRQPTTMDALTSVRHLDFLERNAAFQAIDPFRRVGVMAYNITEDERTMWMYSVYGTGFTFWNPVTASNTYGTIGDTRYATEIGDSGGVSFAVRATHLLFYDEPSNGRYLLHVGAGYNFSQLGGSGNTGSGARTFEARAIPEFTVGDPAAGGATAGGTPSVVDSGRFLATSYNYWHTEFAGNAGPAHFQTEFLCSDVQQLHGPTVVIPGAYVQCGYFLTGESAGYNKQAGVLDYNVDPFASFFGLGRGRGFCGWGAWEVAFRYSYLDDTTHNILAANQLSTPAPPTGPTGSSVNPGQLNETTLALNWWWNKFTRMQFNWIHSIARYNSGSLGLMDIYAGRFQFEF